MQYDGRNMVSGVVPYDRHSVEARRCKVQDFLLRLFRTLLSSELKATSPMMLHLLITFGKHLRRFSFTFYNFFLFLFAPSFVLHGLINHGCDQ